jgi:15-cis-phytoene synthase
VTEALDLCRTSIARHSKSFALASRILPPVQRDCAAVVYAWCRRADDAIDLVPVAEQASALSRLRQELLAVYGGEALSDPTLSEFQRVVDHCRIPLRYPSELLDGMEMDAVGHEYGSWDDLLLYCYRVASTVGLMMCHVMGVRSDQALPHAIDLGIAMQLTNIARDVKEDWQRGRLYLPDELLLEHGLPRLREHLDGPLLPHHRDRLKPALRELLEVADRYYASSDRGLVYLSQRNALGVAAARWIYSEIGRKIAANGHDVLARRAIVPTHRKLALLVKATVQVFWSGRRTNPYPQLSSVE